jgi:hypothetical protein
MPSHLHTELLAALRGRESKQFEVEESDAKDLGAGGGSSVDKPRGSFETWRTNISDHEEDVRIPDRTFREKLGSVLSAGGTPQPQSQTSYGECCDVQDEGSALMKCSKSDAGFSITKSRESCC